MPSATWILAAGFAVVGWWYVDHDRTTIGSVFLGLAAVWVLIGWREWRRKRG